MTDPNQAAIAMESQGPLIAAGEALQAFVGRISARLKDGLEAMHEIPANYKILGTAAVAAFALAHAEAAVADPDSVAGENVPAQISGATLAGTPEASVSNTVSHPYTSLTTKPVLNKIHRIIHRFSDDSTQNGNCHLGGEDPFHVPCTKDVILSTSAFLTPNAGGFTTDCKNPRVSTYHFYKITPNGQSYHTCGPGVIPGGIDGQDQKTKPGEFQGKLNHQGHVIEDSVNLSFQQTTTRIGGNRKKITATYECPDLAASPGSTATTTATEGVKKIVINKSHMATVTSC